MPETPVTGSDESARHGADDDHTDTGHAHTSGGEPTDDSTGHDALRAMRRARRRNRLADLEWFEMLYRVYIAAFLGGGAVLFLSDLVTDEPIDAAGIADVTAHGPAVLGVIAAVMVAIGLRSGANGGPIAVEDPDVRHVLLAPLDQKRVLSHPAVQRFRTIAFAGAVAGGVTGQLAGRRLPGTELAWAMSGALFGALCGALFISVALLAHAARLPRWAATLLAGGVVAWQVAAALDHVPGPADGLGETALWGMEVHSVDVVSVIAVVLVAVASMQVLRRLSLEALARRSALVSQLRFAVTLQDIRTVMLLRRQLAQEHSRERPWIRLPRRGRLPATWRRGWHGILRFPVSRLVRMLLLVAVAAVCQVFVWNGTSPAIVGSGIALFVLGLELLEPLSQAVDQTDRTDAMPRARGETHVALLLPSAVIGVLLGLVGVLVAWALEPSGTTLAIGAIVAGPMMLGGMAGAALNVVGGAPDPAAEATERTLMPPEVAGTTTLIKAVWPVAVSVVASTAVLGARTGVEQGSTPAAAALRMSILPVLVALAGGAWVRYRDEVKRWMRESAQQGNAMRRGETTSSR